MLTKTLGFVVREKEGDRLLRSWNSLVNFLFFFFFFHSRRKFVFSLTNFIRVKYLVLSTFKNSGWDLVSDCDLAHPLREGPSFPALGDVSESLGRFVKTYLATRPDRVPRGEMCVQ